MPLFAVLAVESRGHYYTLPKQGDGCSVLANYPKPCTRKPIICVMGHGYMGRAGYCRKCWDKHHHNRDDLDTIIEVLQSNAIPIQES